MINNNSDYLYILLIIFIIIMLKIYSNQIDTIETFKISDSVICGVTEDNQLWCAWEDILKNPKWNKIKGNIKNIVVTKDNELYGIDTDDNLYFRKDYEEDYKNPINWVIPNIPGEELKKLKSISSDKNMICGVDTDGIIHCYDRSNLIDPRWDTIEGPEEDTIFKNVTIKNHRLFAITEDDEIYYKERYNHKQWQLLSNSLRQISVDRNVVCGTDIEDKIHCYDNNKINNPNWVMIEGKLLKNVIVKDGMLIGTDANNEIFTTPDYKDENPKWRKIPGVGLKQLDMVKKTNEILGIF